MSAQGPAQSGSERQMTYRGFEAGAIHFDEERPLFHGEVAGIRDVVTFQGRDTDELLAAFRGSDDDYIDFCAADGVPQA